MIEAPPISWWAIGPEVTLAIGAMIALLVGMGSSNFWRVATYVIGFGTLIAAGVLSGSEFDTARLGAWSGQLDADRLAQFGRMLAIAAGAATLLFSWRSRPPKSRHGEYVALILAAVCGMGLFAGAGSLVTLFVGLELFSIALYVLCAFEVDRFTSIEAGFKYLVLGGLASALLLYGSALTYGATGELDLSSIGAANGHGLLLHTGLALIIAALAFKATAAPLHWWAPDVYDGAPTTITAFMATATKAVALLATVRVLVVAFGGDASFWEPAVAAIAAASVVAGNLGAIVQNNLKRLLAWSGIAQAGYFLIGVVAWDTTGIPALIYALVAYVAMSLGAFAIVLLRERQLSRPVTFDDLKGAGWVPMAGTPWLSVLPGIGLTVCALSLAGIPPLGGFFAKFMLFDAGIASDYTWLVFVGIAGSVVSLAYYLRIPIALYMQAPEDEAATERSYSPEPLLGALGVAGAAAVIVIAVLPSLVVDSACDARNGVVGNTWLCERSTIAR
jgi:NADH-quinone oxidoreductase subunit N